MEADERARAGLFLAFQYPSEIPGVKVSDFLRLAVSAAKGEDISVFEFFNMATEKMQLLEMNEDFLKRYLNEGFSGGEKKRHEILQIAAPAEDRHHGRDRLRPRHRRTEGCCARR